MKKFTVQDVMDLDPCRAYPEERVAELWAGRDGLTAAEIAEIDIPDEDRVWALCNLLAAESESSARHFACDCAERALTRVYCPDPRAVAAVAVARRYADGQATDEEIAEAEESALAAETEADDRAESTPERAAALAANAKTAARAARAASWAASMAASWAASRAARLAAAESLFAARAARATGEDAAKAEAARVARAEDEREWQFGDLVRRIEEEIK